METEKAETLATPAHCKHWITTWHHEVSYGSEFYWRECVFCKTTFDHSSRCAD